MARGRSLRGIFRKFWDAFLDFIDGEVPVKSSMKSDVEAMFGILEQKRGLTSMKMTLADDAKKKLQLEVSNFDALGKQAESFLRQGQKQLAERCVVRQLQAKNEVARLEKEYEARQKDAESDYADFLRANREAKTRAQQLPQLQRDARLIKAEEDIRELSQALSLDGPKNSFDQIAEDIQIRKLQLQNAQLLDADPNAELDQKIKESIEGDELAHAMAELELKAGQMPEAEIIEADEVSSARKLLETPRYQGVLLQKNPESEKVRVR